MHYITKYPKTVTLMDGVKEKIYVNKKEIQIKYIVEKNVSLAEKLSIVNLWMIIMKD